MKTSTLLKAANKYYPDGYIANYFNMETGKEKEDDGAHGDTLALFIGREVGEEELTPEEAIRRMETAKDEIDRAIRGLSELIKT